MKSVKVIYIAGEGRSGSTLLSRLLGQVGGLFLAGEARLIWRCLATQALCGCGSPVIECPTWEPIITRVLPDLGPNIAEEIESLRGEVDRLGRLPGRIWSHRPVRDSQTAHYISLTSAVYQAISEVTGCRVIVDSSKSLSYLSVLQLVPGLDLRVVHLVRDSRGVANSLGKVVLNPGTRGHLPRYGAFTAGVRWTAINSILTLLRRRMPKPSLLVRYEDFVDAPRSVLDTILTLAEFPQPKEYPFLSNRTTRLGEDHTLAGNPMRFRQGDICLRTDERWREDLGSLQRGMVTVLTLPHLFYYGYIGKRRRKGVCS